MATPSSVRVGKPGNTSRVGSTSEALTVNGPITFYGGDIYIGGDLISTALGSPIVLKGTGHVYTYQGTSSVNRKIQTNGGDIILWSNSAGGATGGTEIENYTFFDSRTNADRAAGTNTTGGGWIVVGGSISSAGAAVTTPLYTRESDSNALTSDHIYSTEMPAGYTNNVSGYHTGLSLGNIQSSGQTSGI